MTAAEGADLVRDRPVVLHPDQPVDEAGVVVVEIEPENDPVASDPVRRSASSVAETGPDRRGSCRFLLFVNVGHGLVAEILVVNPGSSSSSSAGNISRADDTLSSSLATRGRPAPGAPLRRRRGRRAHRVRAGGSPRLASRSAAAPAPSRPRREPSRGPSRESAARPDAFRFLPRPSGAGPLSRSRRGPLSAWSRRSVAVRPVARGRRPPPGGRAASSMRKSGPISSCRRSSQAQARAG